MSNFYHQNARMTLALPPKDLKNPTSYVVDQLDMLLLKQFFSTEKIMLSYSNLQISPVGTVSYYQPEILINVQFTALLYSPKDVILAEVTTIMQSRAQLLINGFFEGEIQFDSEKLKLKQGQLVRCRVESRKPFKKIVRFCCSFDDYTQLGVVLKSNQQPDEATGQLVTDFEDEPEALEQEIEQTEETQQNE